MMSVFTNIRLSSLRIAMLGLAGMLSVLALGIIIPASAFAASSQASSAYKCGTTDVKCVIAFGDTRITLRQTALTTLQNRVQMQQNAQHITAQQASGLLADITTNQNSMASLKSKLDAESDAQAARQDIKAMYEQYRIFAVVLPRDYRQLHLDLEINLDSKLRNAQPRIQQRIAKASSSVQAQVNPLFADYQAQLTAAEGQINVAQGIFPAITVQNFNTNRATYRNSLINLTSAERTALTDLHKAVNDWRQINQALKGSAS